MGEGDTQIRNGGIGWRLAPTLLLLSGLTPSGRKAQCSGCQDLEQRYVVSWQAPQDRAVRADTRFTTPIPGFKGTKRRFSEPRRNLVHDRPDSDCPPSEGHHTVGAGGAT